MPGPHPFASAKCAALAVLIGVAPSAAAEEPAYPADSVLLFVAAWCAPCRAELARLDEIEAAAGTKIVRVVPFDDDAGTAAMLDGVKPRLLWRPGGWQARAVREDVSGRTAGLPYGLVTDRAGRPCAETRRGLTGPRVRALVAQCAASPGTKG